MEKLNKIISTAVPLQAENIDTDQIIPARFLKAIDREGFGENLFRDWRYNKDNSLKKDFVLNGNIYKGSILVAGKNFGCGSSREHAAWAIHDYGFRVVISSFFADIFKANTLNNGLLPIVVSDEVLHQIFTSIEKDADQKFEVDLQNQTLSIGENIISFDIDIYKKECLLNGHDDIDFLLSLSKDIVKFEKEQVIY